MHNADLVCTAEYVYRVRVGGRLSDVCAVRIDSLRFALYDGENRCLGTLEGHSSSHALMLVTRVLRGGSVAGEKQ